MADFFRIVKCHRLYLFLLLLILGFVYIIRDDYVVKDAFREQGEEAVCVTGEQSLEAEIFPSGDGLRSVLLHIVPPSCPAGQFTTTVSVITGEGMTLYSQSFANDTVFEVNDVRGNATEFDFGQTFGTDGGTRYFLTVSSDAPNQENAFGFGMDQDGKLWYRLSYLIWSNRQFKQICFLFAFLLATAVYLLLMRDKKFFRGGVELPSRKILFAGFRPALSAVSDGGSGVPDAG